MEFETYVIRATGQPEFPLEIVSVVTKECRFLPEGPDRWQSFENSVALCASADEAKSRMARLLQAVKKSP